MSVISSHSLFKPAVLLLAVFVLSSLLLAKKDESGKKQKPVDTSNQPAQDGVPAPNPDAKPKMTGEQKWMQVIRAQLKVTDEEWAVLAPRVNRIVRLQNEVEAGRDRQGVRIAKAPKWQVSGNLEGTAAIPPPPDARELAKQLNEVLLDPAVPAADIRARVAAVREARAKARQELLVAQEDLQQLLTYRQEGVLIVMGLLD